MLYIVAIIALVFLVIYFLWRWLSSEAGYFIDGARIALKLRRGSRTPGKLLEEALAAFHERKLEPDLVIVSHDALRLYDRLRQRVIGHTNRPDLPAAVVIALGIDVNAGLIYLRAIDTPAGGAGRETTGFHAFDRIERFELGPHSGPSELVASADQCLILRIAQADPTEYHLAVEPGWHLAPTDLKNRLHHLLVDRQTPPTAPVIVR